ncbi:MAG: ComEC/Rec2 family competence protein, partial [Lachnospiraceae bacterium]|nr:ComEC/Rec2 family competence protein [Lachnospiraceae bacterium]
MPLLIPKINGPVVDKLKGNGKKLIAAGPFLFLAGYVLFTLDNASIPEESMLRAGHDVSINGEHRVVRTEVREKNVKITVNDCFIVFADRDDLTENLKPGDIIRVTGSAELFDRPSNPGQFDSERYYRSLGIRYMCRAENIALVSGSRDPAAAVSYYVRKQAEEAIDDLAPGEDGYILKAMLLGDRSFLTDDMKDSFRYAGLSHILVVSGLHITLIGEMIYRLLMQAGTHRYAALCLSFLGVSFFCLLCGRGLSAERGMLMFLYSAAARLLGRTYDMKTASVTVMAFMLLEKPCSIYNTGFLLSFGSVLAIAFIMPVILDSFTDAGMNRYAADVLAAPLSISLLMMPVSA